jgi:hypothetical protein
VLIDFNRNERQSIAALHRVTGYIKLGSPDRRGPGGTRWNVSEQRRRTNGKYTWLRWTVGEGRSAEPENARGRHDNCRSGMSPHQVYLPLVNDG